MPNLSFFKFSPEQWLTGKIQALSALEKGIFIDLAARIWQAGGALENSPVLYRVLRVEKKDFEDAISAFIEFGIIDIEDGKISMKFIREQISEIEAYSQKQAERGAAGGRKKSENMALANASLASASGGIASAKGGLASANASLANKDKDKDNIQREKENIIKEKVSSLFNRRPTTPWSEKETKQLREIAKRPEAIQELAIIEALYNSGYIYRRRDILTLLNNWTVELDRAQARGMGAPGNDLNFTESERNDNADRF